MSDEDALVKFFESLSRDARREYDELAKRDREFGEDVSAEEAARRVKERS